MTTGNEPEDKPFVPSYRYKLVRKPNGTYYLYDTKHGLHKVYANAGSDEGTLQAEIERLNDITKWLNDEPR